MEVVFQPGLEGLGERLLAGKRGKAGRNSETVWDTYMRKRKCVFATSPLTPPFLAHLWVRNWNGSADCHPNAVPKQTGTLCWQHVRVV